MTTWDAAEAGEELSLGAIWDHQVRSRRTAEFLVFGDPDTGQVRTYSYGEFDAWVNQVAHVLADAGVGQRTRVAVHLYNSPEFIACLLALAKIGGVLVPISPAYSRVECADIVARTTPLVLVTEPELLAIHGDEQLAAIGTVLSLGGNPEHKPGRVLDFTTTVGEASPEPGVHPALDGSDLLEVMFTSGTTARPKGVMLTHANFVFSGLFVNWQLAMGQDDRFYSSMVGTHVNLQLSALAPVITAGATMIFEKRYSATRAWAQVRRHRATLIQSMAMMVRTMMAQPVAPDERDHQVRLVHYFLPITDDEKAAFEHRFGVRLLNNYGSSESLVGVLTERPFGPTRWPSVGRVGLGYRVRVASDAGHPMPVGEVGEIQVRGIPGVSLMAGYWRDPARTDACFTDDGWMHTSDCGRMDADGWFYFVDRNVDVIKRAGETISSAEVEDALLHQPGVVDAAVVGVPDPIKDEAIEAFVVPALGVKLDVEQIRKRCAERLAYFKVPEAIHVSSELPRGNYGKIRKDLLRKELMTAKGRSL